MNLNRYNQLYDYLKSDKLLEEFTDYEKKQLINQARYFEIRCNLLYKKNQKDPEHPLWVIKCTEVELILYIMHKHPTTGHLRTDTMYYKIAKWYYWNQMYRDIQEYVKTCETC